MAAVILLSAAGDVLLKRPHCVRSSNGPSRPYWKGYLKLSLVLCPIALYTATSRVAFRQINRMRLA
jgi:hypothetical protein